MPATQRCKTSPRRLAAHERHSSALALRRSGMGYERIAKELGYATPSGAYNAVMTVLMEARTEPLEAVRALEAQRLDIMLAGLFERARGGDDAAVATAIKVMNRRAAMLGLDAPRKQELSGDPDLPVMVKVLKGVTLEDI